MAVVSGLSIGSSSPADAQIQMLVEYLAGEAGGPDDQQLASQITRLIIAGNSLSLAEYNEEGEEEKKPVSKSPFFVIADDQVYTRENSAHQHRHIFLLIPILLFPLIFMI